LLAIGRSGPWEVAIDQTTLGPERWFAQIEGPSLYLYFEIPSLDVVDKAIAFLRTSQEQRPPATLENGHLSLGTPKNPVSLVRDDECLGRCFLTIGDRAIALVQFTVSGTALTQLIAALLQAQEDLHEES
jgi:hypothetical protein